MDLTNQKFGKLTVIGRNADDYISPQGKRTPRWDCICDCGNTIIVLQNSLTAAKNGTRSCGCTRHDHLRHDLTGQRFGRLLVIGHKTTDQPISSSGVKTLWICQCDCGNVVKLTQKQLCHDNVRSCGCLLRDTACKKIENNTIGFFSGTSISAISPDRPANKNSRSGVKGVYYSNRENRWIAKITFRGKAITIGRFNTIEAAAKARAAAEKEYFGQVLNTPEAQEYLKEINK